MILAALLCAGLTGGHVYAAAVESAGARLNVVRYVAAGERRGAPVVLFGELGFGGGQFDLGREGLARTLQARGREVFVLEWAGTGRSTEHPAPVADLETAFAFDAPAALDLALRSTGAPCAQVVGVGLGGAAAYLLGDKACAVVAVSVPRAYEVPNVALGRLLRAVEKAGHSRISSSAAPVSDNPGHTPVSGSADSAAEKSGHTPVSANTQGAAAGKSVSVPIFLRDWLAFPSTLDPLMRRDLFSLLLGADLPEPRAQAVRAMAGRVSPGLVADVARWMERGDLALAHDSLSAAVERLRAPLLIVAAPRDNLVHPEHALARIHGRPNVETIVLSRIEGYPEDAGHLALQSPRAREKLFPRIAEWLANAPGGGSR